MSTNETIKHVGQLRWLAQFYDDPSIDGIALYVEQLQAEIERLKTAHKKQYWPTTFEKLFRLVDDNELLRKERAELKHCLALRSKEGVELLEKWEVESDLTDRVQEDCERLERERDAALAKIERLTKRETALEDENEKYNKHFIEEMDDNARLRKERDEALAEVDEALAEIERLKAECRDYHYVMKELDIHDALEVKG